MTLTINGMIFEGSEDEIRRIAENPPRKPQVESEGLECDHSTTLAKSVRTHHMTCCEGMKSKSDCPFYLNGYCSRCVLASNPPQYQACAFECDIPFYEQCSKVNEMTI